MATLAGYIARRNQEETNYRAQVQTQSKAGLVLQLLSTNLDLKSESSDRINLSYLRDIYQYGRGYSSC